MAGTLFAKRPKNNEEHNNKKSPPTNTNNDIQLQLNNKPDTTIKKTSKNTTKTDHNKNE